MSLVVFDGTLSVGSIASYHCLFTFDWVKFSSICIWDDGAGSLAGCVRIGLMVFAFCLLTFWLSLQVLELVYARANVLGRAKACDPLTRTTRVSFFIAAMGAHLLSQCVAEC